MTCHFSLLGYCLEINRDYSYSPKYNFRNIISCAQSKHSSLNATFVAHTVGSSTLLRIHTWLYYWFHISGYPSSVGGYIRGYIPILDHNGGPVGDPWIQMMCIFPIDPGIINQSYMCKCRSIPINGKLEFSGQCAIRCLGLIFTLDKFLGLKSMWEKAYFLSRQ